MRRGLGLTLATLVVFVGAFPSATAIGSPPKAGIAKKKCKKHKKHSRKHRRKKCKPSLTKTPAPPSPSTVVRATLTWPQVGYDLDLHSYDAFGNHSGHVLRINYENGIPDASYRPDGQQSGPTLTETLTDRAFYTTDAARNRAFGYLVCFYGHVDGTLTLIDRSGAPHTIMLPDTGSGSAWVTLPGESIPFPEFNPC
jgi:hypothetical protein